MSLTMDATQQAILANPRKKITWLFEVSPAVPVDSSSVFYWSTKDVSYDGQNYSFKIDRDSFSGINLNRPKSEHNMIAPSDVSFRAKFDYDHADDFRGGSVLIKVVMGAYLTGVYTERVIRQFRMDIDSCVASGGYLKFKCIDFVQKYLKGNYPLNPLSRTIFPSSRGDVSDDAICVPKIFGTAYIPLKCIYYEADSPGDPVPSGRYYLIGPADKTYTITKVRTPREWASVVEWDSSDTTFNQHTVIDSNGDSWKILEPLIADMDADGVLDSVGVFPGSGDALLDLLVEISQTDTATTTNPADIIYQYLVDIGVPTEFIDYGTGSSFDVAGGIFDTWGLDWEGAFFFRQQRTKTLAQLLNMCHSTLVLTDKIELHVLSKTSQSTFTQADILMKNRASSFEITTSLNQEPNDCGVIGYAPTGYPQDALIQRTVAAKSTLLNPSGTVLELPFVRDDENAQRLGALCFQRAFLAGSDLNFDSKMSKAHLVPDDVITIDSTRYGGTYPVLVDGVRFSLSSIHFTATKYIDILDDWEDLAPVSLDLVSDTSEGTWRYVIAGPDSPTGMVVNALPGRLRVGDSILFDPDKFSGAGAIQVGQDLEHDEPFNIHDKLYWDHILDALFARNLWISGELHASVMAIDEVHANGGTQLLSGGGVLAENITTPAILEDDFVIRVNENATGDYSYFSAGDFIQMKIGDFDNGAVIEAWMEVLGPLRDDEDDNEGLFLVKLKSGSTSTTFPEGTAVVNWGAATDRKMLLTSDMAHSPYLDIFITGETPWEGVTTTTRLGNLLGIYDEDFGGQLSGEGLYSTNAFLKGIIHAYGGIIGTGGEGIILDGANKLIRSANYDAGVDGFQIESTGHVEMNDATVRGSIEIGAGSSGIANLSDAGALALLDEIYTRNHIDNGDFAQWSNGASAAPDGWTLTGHTGGAVAREGTIKKIGAYSAKLTSTTVAGEYKYVYQDVHDSFGIAYWRGRTVTVGAWLWCDTASALRICVQDGVWSDGTYHPGDGQWHWVTVTYTIKADASRVRPYALIQSGSGVARVGYVDCMILVEGSYCPAFDPRGVSNAQGTGLVLDGYRMGYISGGVWQTYIQNNGSFRFGGNANNYLLWNGTNFSVYTTGLFTVSGGGSIVAQGHDTSPGKIIWQGSSSSIEAYASLGGNYFTMVPTTPYASQFDIGTVDHSFSRFYVKTRTDLELRSERSADEFAYLDTSVTTSVSLLSLVSMQGSDSAVISLYTTAGTRRINLTGHLRTATNNTYDIGTSSEYFRNIYANRYYYKQAPTSFDIIDDLQALKNIKEKKRYDGTSVLDPIQNIPIIETATLPESVLAHYEEDVPAEIYEADDGSLIQLRPGKKKGDIIYGDDGEPFIDGSNLMAFLLGSARNLVIYAEGLENRIKELENIMLRNEGKINGEG